MPNSAKVITLENHFPEVKGQVTGDVLMKAAQAGGHVIEAYAKIKVNMTFSHKATGGAGLGGSIQVVASKSTKIRAEVDVGPTVIYGRIHELGGVILPVHAKMLSWVADSGERIFASRVQILARPYLRPAVDEHENEIRDAVGFQIKKGIESVTT